MAWEADLGATTNAERHIEPCPDVIARTQGERVLTDDNMGTEWRYPLRLE
jgi:hypothetical protein